MKRNFSLTLAVLAVLVVAIALAGCVSITGPNDTDARLIFYALGFFSSSCESCDTYAEPASVFKISGPDEVGVGEYITLSYTENLTGELSPYNVVGVTYATGDKEILRVEKNRAYGVAEGQAEVTLTVVCERVPIDSQNQFTSCTPVNEAKDYAIFAISSCSPASQRVTFTDTKTITVKSYDFSLEDVSLYPGERKNARIFHSENLGADRKWEVKNTSIATVDPDGLITGLKEGSTTLNLTSGGRTAESKIVVSDFELSIPETSLSPGETRSLSVAGFPKGYSAGKAGTWSSSDLGVAAVNKQGALTAIQKGECTVTFTHAVTGKTASANVAVTDFTISLDPPSAALLITQTQKFAVINFPQGYTASLSGTWESGDASVAAVDGQGQVTAKSAGKCAITFTHTATGKTASADVDVADFTLSLNPASVQLAPAESTSLSVVGFPAGYTDVSGTWISDGETVAVVGDSGQVTAKAVGQCAITFTHTATGKSASASVEVVGGGVPSIAGASNILLIVGYAEHVESYTVTGDPPLQLTVDAQENQFSIAKDGKLTVGTGLGAGTYTVVIKAENLAGTASKNVTVTVSERPVIVLGPDSTDPIKVGVLYALQLTATGGTGSYTFAAQSGQVPPGLSLDATGAVSGTPTAYGTWQATVVATDAQGFTGSKVFSFTVEPADLVIITESPLKAKIDKPFTAQLEAAGGVGPYVFGIEMFEDEALPFWLQWNTDGELSGTPFSLTGDFPFVATVVDSKGTTVQKDMVITVTQPLIFNGGEIWSITVGIPYTYDWLGNYVSGGTPPYTYSLAAGTLPTGITLDPSGIISGTVWGEWGDYYFTLTVTDADGETEDADFGVTVSALDRTGQLLENFNLFGEGAHTPGEGGVVPVAEPNAAMDMIGKMLFLLW